MEATIQDTADPGTTSVKSKGTVTVSAKDTSTSNAFALAASASIAGSTTASGIAVTVGLALAHNTIDKDLNASIVNVSSVLTNGGDVVVLADDDSDIEVYSFAAAVAVAVSGNISAAVAGGAAESTNIILNRSNAWISNSSLGTAAEKVGKVDLDVDSSAEIDAVVGTISAAVAFGKTAVGVAIGVAVARNFIGWGLTIP